MASAKELKTRINGIQDTYKITRAMHLIASTKMQRAKNELDRTRPYFDALKCEIKRIFRTVGDVESRYFYPADGTDTDEGTYACLVITADKGLAGAYNQNVLKEAERLLSQHNDIKLFVVGEYGRQYFIQRKIPIERSFLYTAQNPTLHRAREITSILLELYDNRIVNKIFVIYTDMANGLTAEAKSTRLLPFHRSHFPSHKEESAVTTPFEFSPSVCTVLDNVIPSYITGFIYSALVDSFFSEQHARMTAMSTANQNAEQLLSELSVQYHHLRQAAITQEIIEIAAGSRAQKHKQAKEVQFP